jgi:hypothetical protein
MNCIARHCTPQALIWDTSGSRVEELAPLRVLLESEREMAKRTAQPFLPYAATLNSRHHQLPH